MSAGQYRVVGVDDSTDDLLLLQRALRQNSVLNLAATFGDGLQAIAYLNGDGACADRKQWPIRDLLLVDIKMPIVGGFGVLAWFATQPGKEFKVGMLTSALAEIDRVKALQRGAD